MAAGRRLRRSRLAALIASASLGAAVPGGPGAAQVVTDGSVGPAGAVAGPHYAIGSELGAVRGGNLFHSFERFSIRQGESATFTGPGSIRNVISRVTGGDVSTIHGTLRSGIAAANVFLINPAGVVFGAGAQVDVSGAFVVSTADELRLADGGVFAATHPADTVLTTAPPAAFGFLGGNRGAIAIHRTTIEGADDKAVTLAAGDVKIRRGGIASSGGTVDLVAVGDVGVVDLTPTAAAGDGTGGGGGAGGNVTLRSRSRVSVEGAGSRLAIRGGRIAIDDSRITSTDSSRGGMTLQAGNLAIRHGGAAVASAVDDAGGHVRVTADRLIIDGSGSVEPTGLFSFTEGGANGGNVRIVADDIRLLYGGQVVTTTRGDGAGGNVSIQSTHFIARGQNLIDLPGGVLTTTEGENVWGDGGDIRLFANHGVIREHGVIGTSSVTNGLCGNILVEGGAFAIREAALVQASTLGAGPGGAIRFNLRAQLTIVGTGTSDLFRPTTGIHTDNGHFTPILSLVDDTGPIDIRAGSVHIANGGGASITTTGRNGLGDLRVAAQTVRLTGRGSGLFVNSQSDYLATGDPNDAYTGDAGNIKVEAKLVEVLDLATITASASGTGQGGNIVVRANDLVIDGTTGRGDTGAGTGITASTTLPVIPGRPDIVGGDAGNILLDVSGGLTIRNGGGVSVFTRGGGDGGDLVVRAGRLAMYSTPETMLGADVFSPAELSATTESRDDGAGRAGAIAVRAGDITIGPGTRLTAGTFGPGLGGVVHLASTGDLVIDGEGYEPRPTIDVSYGSVSGQGESGNLLLWAADDLIIRDAAITATAVSGDGGYVAIGTTRPDAPYRVKRQKLTPRRLMIEDSDVEAESARGNGGWVLLHAKDLVSVRHGRLAASAMGRGGRIDIDPEVVVIDDVDVFARAELLEGGDISVRGGTYLRSPESVFDVTSQSGLDGSISEAAQLDLSGTLLPLVVSLGDDMAQLFEQCTVKLGQGISSFIVVGRGGLPTEPGLWLPAYATPAPSGDAGAGE